MLQMTLQKGMVMISECNRYFDSDNRPIDNPYLAMIEVTCISWFTIEYLLRYLSLTVYPIHLNLSISENKGMFLMREQTLISFY